MNKFIIHIVFLFFTVVSFSQTKDLKTKTWESEKDLLEYKKKSKYDGPDDWNGSYPASMQDEDYYGGSGSSSSGSSRSYNGIQYSPQRIQRDRQERYQGFDRGGGGGTVEFDPTVERPDPVDIPDIDPPDIDAPDIDLPDIDIDGPSESFWKILLFILIASAVIFIVFLIFKNKQPANKKVIVDVEDDWNPEVISKTELELRLEAAMEKEDYRECVRIYFTFILKELIKKSWIRWKKDKTNHHYLMEMQGKPNQFAFAECVRIYDLVWYGEYEIDRAVFEMLQPTLENYYKSLEPSNE
ncbi:MAG: hypothetical protein MK066_06030 [Crocinitomicaceae bacterium]|nr:hypothetical protein [Crocinitomicaceae bacterium]